MTIAQDAVDKNAANKALRFSFDFHGYPHALQFISPDWPNQPDVIEPDDTIVVKITSPKPDTPFDVGQEVKVPLEFEVYARPDFLDHPDELKDKIEIRTFGEAGGDVLPWTQGRPKLLYDRQPEIVLRGTRANGELKVSTTVGKFHVPFALALPRQKVRIDVSAYASYTPVFGQRRSNSGISAPFVDSVTVILDERPEVQEPPLPRRIELGQPLNLALAVKSLCPIDQFDCGFEDPDEREKFASDPKKVKANRVSEGAWSASIPTDKLEVGQQRRVLLVRVKNGIGETVKRWPFTLKIERPVVEVVEKKPPDLAKKGRIFGVVAFKHAPDVRCSSGKVHLDAKGEDESAVGRNRRRRPIRVQRRAVWPPQTLGRRPKGHFGPRLVGSRSR